MGTLNKVRILLAILATGVFLCVLCTAAIEESDLAQHGVCQTGRKLLSVDVSWMRGGVTWRQRVVGKCSGHVCAGFCAECT